MLRNNIFESGARNHISGYEGSQTVLACPSGKGNAFVRNRFLMTLKEVDFNNI
jgi:hypothetical protein